MTAGIILLMQHLHRNLTGELAEVDRLVELMHRGGVEIHDGDDESDNVDHTNQDFIRIDAMGSLDALTRSLQKDLLESEAVFRA